MIYAGIGSRETPPRVLSFMHDVGKVFAQRGYTLRSGHALGADWAFEQGTASANGAMEIYLPWPSYNHELDAKGGTILTRTEPSEEAHFIAEQFHPAWHRCSDAARKLHARNTHIIAGSDCNTPVDFIVCWTKDGKPSGGTGQALRIAAHLKISVYNMFNPADQVAFAKFVRETRS